MLEYKMRNRFVIIIFFAALSFTTAQSLGGSFMVGSPQGEFRSNVNRLGYGFQLYGTLWAPSKERPITIGLDFGYMVYGHVTQHDAWRDFPGVFLNLERSNNLASAHVLFQLSPFNGDVRPYIEGLFGGAYIFTESSVKSENYSETIASSTNYDDFTWNYGGGAGLWISLAKNLGTVDNLFLDLKVRYLYGTTAEYLTEESVYVNSRGETYFMPQKSKTDFLIFHVGVVAAFNLYDFEER
jgi:hypothetical protein